MDERMHREQFAFLEKHSKEADLLVFDERTKICIRAEYYSPMKKAQDDIDARLRAFFILVKELEEEQGR